MDNNGLLPTFTCGIKNQLIRARKGGGCLSNLISEGLVKDLGLKGLKIFGINYKWI